MAEIVKLSAQMTRKYGAIDMSFGIVRDVEVSEGKDIIQAYDTLCAILERQVEEYEMHRFKNLPAPMQQAASGSGGGKKTEPIWYPASKLVLSANQGKKFWRILPGGDCPWKKYGATIFWDTFQGFTEGEAKEMLQPGEFEAPLGQGCMVLIAVEGGKPKALKIEYRAKSE